MTPSRAALIALVALSAGHSPVLWAQLVPNPGGGQGLVLPVTVNDAATRVPFSVQGSTPEFSVHATYGPNYFYCSRDIGNSPLSPAALKPGLVRVAEGKTAARLRDLVTQIDAAPDRSAKLRLMFGWDNRFSLTTPPLPETWAQTDPDYMNKLRMGEEVRSWGPACYTVSQVDQIIAEGLRVLSEVAQAIPGLKPPAGVDAPVRR